MDHGFNQRIALGCMGSICNPSLAQSFAHALGGGCCACCKETMQPRGMTLHGWILDGASLPGGPLVGSRYCTVVRVNHGNIPKMKHKLWSVRTVLS